jgi:hypothetical protein
MMRTHITEEQLVLWLDSADDAYFTVDRHVRDCEMCARWVADERLFRCLMTWQSGRVARSPHIDDETLAAYAEERLAPEEMQSVTDHLVACDRCLVELVDLRFLMHAAAADPPGDEVFNAAREMMARLARRWLGHLRVLIDEPWPRISWHPSIFTRPAPAAPERTGTRPTVCTAISS